MWRYVFLLMGWTAASQISRTTADGRALSPSGTRVAYYELCSDDHKETCPPRVVILGRDGQQLQAFNVTTEDGPCVSILMIVWVSENVIGADCHVNPSLGNYIETDLTTGKTLRNLMGYWFTPSPDGKHVAHVGWYPHFARPWGQSNYLQIDETTIYPRKTGPNENPNIAARRGDRWVGIYDFQPDLQWSPDSIRVAFIDCTYDWVEKADMPEGGAAMNNRCRVVVVSLTGRVEVAYELPRDAKGVTIEWNSPGKVSVRGTFSKQLEVF